MTPSAMATLRRPATVASLLAASSSAAAAAAAARRAYAIPSSAVDYTRRGDQPPAAPLAVKAVSKTAAGITVASFDGRGPASSLAIVVGAGSRQEDPAAPGVAHMLKGTLVRTIPGDNLVRTIRELELRGDSLYTAVGREQLLIGSSFLRDDLVDIVPLLFGHAFNPSFQPYEFLDAIPFVTGETSTSLSDPKVKVLEALHSVAFRSGLGNAFFATPAEVKNLKRAHLQAFAAKYFTTGRIAVVGSGVAHNELTALVEEATSKLAIASGTAADSASKYFGGEARISGGPSSQSLYTVAYKSVGFTSPDYASSLVLSALLGGSPSLKWGSLSGSTSLLSSAATADTAATSLDVSYTDSGLIGFTISGKASDVKPVAQKGIEALKSAASGQISAEALSRAKKAAIVAADSKFYGSADQTINEVAKQVLASGKYQTSSEIATAISGVTADDVAKVAKLAVSSKPSVVAYGNLQLLPYADEL